MPDIREPESEPGVRCLTPALRSAMLHFAMQWYVTKYSFVVLHN